MKVRIWGVRGSIPAPLTSQAIREKMIMALQGARDIDLSDPLAIQAYVDRLPPLVAGTAGGNTSCIEVQADDQTVIIDAGTGIRPLGLELMAGPCGHGEGVLHLFFSHLHWDHIQGFPFFVPAYVPGNRLFIYSFHQAAVALRNQMKPDTFPITLDAMRANIHFVPLEEGQPINLGSLSITPCAVPHPGRSYAYRFEHHGRVFIYASDAEYKYLDEDSLKPYLKFFTAADALLFDAQFTLRESLTKEDWGHSSSLIGVDIARRAGVKKLILTHHDPASSDTELMQILEQTIDYQATYEPNPSCEIVPGQEGMTFNFEPVHPFVLQQLSDKQAAILIPADDFDQRAVDDLLREITEWQGGPQLPRLVVNMGGITRLSIACLRSLIDLRRKWDSRPMALAALAPHVKQVIELANCLDIFAIYSTVETALAALEAHETLHLPGQLLSGRYCIEAKLGESDLSATYKAQDTRLNRPVMIKVLSSALSQATTENLVREAGRMATLQAPHIVTLFDCDEDHGLAFLVMEYVGSQTLQSFMRHETQPPPLRVVAGILRALEYAHSKGITHGNLRPENILIDNEIKLTDFGLRWTVERPRLAENPELIRDAYYLAPEQITSQLVDPRTDLYALGVLLYELLTGQYPFQGDTAEVLEQHLHRLPIPPRELNAEISRSLEYLVLKLLAKDPEQRYVSATQVRRVLASLELGPTLSNQGETGTEAQMHRNRRKLIGREAHLRRLYRLWSVVQRGQGQVLMIAGEAGVGKTRLAEEIAGELEDAVVVIGHCSELEGNLPYQPFVEVIRSYLAGAHQSDLLEQLGDSANALAALIPELYMFMPASSTPLATEPEQDQRRLMHSLTRLIERASIIRPWLLIIDDLHWSDPASLEVFHYLARNITSIPLFLVGIYRDVELETVHPLRQLVQSLSRLSGYHHIVLNRLDQDGVAQMLESIWEQEVPKEWVTTIYRRTGGNPFYVEEVSRSLMDEGIIVLRDGVWHFGSPVEVKLPRSIRDLVLRRLARLRPATQELLRVAAVIGQQFNFVDLLAITEQPEEQVLESLDEALERDLVREVDGGASLAFSHPEIHEVIYENLSALRRRRLHRRVGIVLEQQYHSSLDLIAEQLANHFIQAGDRERASRYSQQAAQRAHVLHADQVAVSWYTQALALLPDGEEANAKRIELYEGLATVLQRQAHFAEAAAAYTAMRAAAETSNDLVSQARALIELGGIRTKQGDLHAALETLERAEAIARQAQAQPAIADALFRKSWALLRMGHAEVAISLADQVLAIGTETQSREITAKSLNLLGNILSRAGRFEQSTSCFEEALDLYQALGDSVGQALILNNLGVQAYRRGDYGSAIVRYSEALGIAQHIGDRDHEVLFLMNLGLAHTALGEHRTAEAELRRALDMVEMTGPSDRKSIGYRALAEIYLGQGRLSEARTAAQRALALGQGTGALDAIANAWRIMGMIVAQLETSSDEKKQPVGQSREDNPATCFSESARLFEELGMEVEHARTLREWAQYELEQGNRGRGRTLWEKARETFVRLGLTLEAERMGSLPIKRRTRQ